MTHAFDPYDAWLGIPPAERPPDHYRLLGLPRFESDAELIAAAVRAQMARISAHLVGPHATAAQEILAELAAAKRVLLSSEKTAYDDALRQNDKGSAAAASAPVPAMALVPPTTASPSRQGALASEPPAAASAPSHRPDVPHAIPTAAVATSASSAPSHAPLAPHADVAHQAAPPVLQDLLPPPAVTNSAACQAAENSPQAATHPASLPEAEASGLLPPSAIPQAAVPLQPAMPHAAHPLAATAVPASPLPAFAPSPHQGTLPQAYYGPHTAVPQQPHVPQPHVMPQPGLPQQPHVMLPAHVAQPPHAMQPYGAPPAAYPTAQLVGYGTAPFVAPQAVPAVPMAAPTWPAQHSGPVAQSPAAGPQPPAAHAEPVAGMPSQSGVPTRFATGRQLYHRRTGPSNAAAWGVLASLLVILAAVVYFVATSTQDGPSTPGGAAVASNDSAPDATGERSDAHAEQRPTNPPRTNRPPSDPSSESPVRPSRPPNSVSGERPPSGATPHEDNTDERMPDQGMSDESMSNDGHPDPAMPDAQPPVGDMPDTPATNMPVPDLPVPDEPNPDDPNPDKPNPDEPSAHPDPNKSEAVREALAAARKALVERDLDRAEEQLDLAIVAGGRLPPELAVRIEQEQALASAVRAFWEAVRQSMSQLEGTEELKIGNSVAIVVEVVGEVIIIREAGRNQRYSIHRKPNTRELPARLAVALAERWLKGDDPTSKLMVGAFLAVDPQGDRNRAAEYVQEAQQRGAESAALVQAALEGTPE